MIIGTGIDIIEIDRIRKLVLRHPERFIERILTKQEYKRIATAGETRKIEYLAGRFAAKEAYAKAVGSGIGRHLSFQDIEILASETGKPEIWFKQQKKNKCHLSITHSKEYAFAQVILEDF
ncbi:MULTISPECIES: holo-ACP synthase [Shouchella]|uniref:Holo-[acyl-carrier-protein] synthase n=3 Tax=Bacillaceae TaxID=186817 RepID=A0A060M5D5_9BACI|nr:MULTISPECIES: holo-ACP synthase [Bacillaceae]AIC95778.1 Holo-[acyl-carrier-protein] synthase [Shouchella lehensis G1]KQL56696.1 4'-phosphopantetheinyl transferase [Alkalicoccobacillus plakortidis]MBG9784760.1 4'-phosphopantetheinyl transferase [Shouchella lehensis]TES46164.1 holo-ACP synthase [Shouchella lehensis]